MTGFCVCVAWIVGILLGIYIGVFVGAPSGSGPNSDQLMDFYHDGLKEGEWRTLMVVDTYGYVAVNKERPRLRALKDAGRAGDLDLGDWMRLSPADRDRLMGGQ